MKRLAAAALAVGLCAGIVSLGWASGSFDSLNEPRTHVLMRHAEAPGTGDPAGFRLGDCATQRNLSEEGRAQARAIGRDIAAAGAPLDRVLTSQWCRASETAVLLDVAPVEAEPALNSFFGDRGEAEAQSRALKARIAALDADGERAVLVTHQVNITALTGVFPASGEVILVRLEGDDLVVATHAGSPAE